MNSFGTSAVTLIAASDVTRLPATGGAAVFTSTFTNTDTTNDMILEEVNIDLPAGLTYTTGSAKIDGTTVANPTIVGNKLTFANVTVPKQNGTVVGTVVVSVSVSTNQVGNYTATISGLDGTTVIDTTADDTDNAPAQVAFKVVAAPTVTGTNEVTSVGVAKTWQPAITFGDPGTTLDTNGVGFLDPNASNALVTSLVVAGEGTWSVNTSVGAITFTPIGGYVGTTTDVTYRVTDDLGQVKDTIAKVQVADVSTISATPGVGAINSAIEITPTVTTPTGVTVDYSNSRFKDPADDVFKPSVTDTGKGTWTVSTVDGKVTFTPVTGYSGTATIEYKITDSLGRDATVSLSATVVAAPAVTKVTGTVVPGGTVTVNNSATAGTGATIDWTKAVLQDPADSTYKTSVTEANKGVWSISTVDGKVTFDAASNATPGTYSINFRVTDSVGQNATGQFEVTVNAAVVIVANDVTARTSEGTAKEIDLTSSISLGTGRTLDTTKSTVTGANPAHGTWAIDAATSKVTFTPAAGFSGAASATYSVTDNAGANDTGTITVTVAAKPTAQNATAKIRKGASPAQTSVEVDLAGKFGVDTTNGSSLVSVTLVGSDTRFVIAGQKVTFTPAAGDTGNVSVTYKVTDSDGGEKTATITVTIVAAPTATAGTATATAANATTATTATIDLTSKITVDSGATISGITVAPVLGTYTASQYATQVGAWSVNSTTKVVTFVGVAGFSGPATATYEVTDSEGQKVTGNLSVTIQAASSFTVETKSTKPATAVTLKVTPAAGVTVNAATTGLVKGTNLYAAAGETVTSTDGKGTWSYVKNADNSYTVTFTPAAGVTGTSATIPFAVNGVSQNLIVHVFKAPTAPAVTGKIRMAMTPAETNTVLTIAPVADTSTVGAETNKVETVTVTANLGTRTATQYGTEVGAWTYDATAKKITFTPVAAFSGAATATYKVTDSLGLSTDGTATVNVIGAPKAPAVNGFTTQGETTTVTLAPTADSTTVTGNKIETITIAPVLDTPTQTAAEYAAKYGTWTYDAATKKVTFVPAANFSGIAKGTYQVTDTEGQKVTGNMEITVAKALTGEIKGSAAKGSEVAFTDLCSTTIKGLGGFPSDATCDPASVKLWDEAAKAWATTVTVAGKGVWTVNAATGGVTFKPEATFTGDANIAFIAKDTAGNTYGALLAATVTADNGTGTGGTLPKTGAELGVFALVGSALMAAGGALTRMRRRGFSVED